MFRRVCTCLVVVWVWVGCLCAAEPSINHEAYQKALTTLKTKSYIKITQEEMDSILREHLLNVDLDAIASETGTTNQYKWALETILDNLNARLDVDTTSRKVPYLLTTPAEKGFPSAPVVGVGMKLDHIFNTPDSSPTTIIDLLESTRFEGLEVGDEIVKVDGVDALKLRKEGSLIDAIRGVSGSQVTLTLKRGEKTFDVSVERHPVSFPNVELSEVINNIAVIKIHEFSRFTVTDALGEILNHLLKCDIKGIVLDLRHCRGGHLTSAAHCARYFSKTGDLLSKSLFALEGVNCRITKVTQASEDGKASHLSLAVLVNEKTFGAAEALAASLHKEGHPLIGIKTQGYGGMFYIENIGEGFSLQFLHGHVLLPTGELLEGTGITPDIEISESSGESEPIQMAIEALNL